MRQGTWRWAAGQALKRGFDAASAAAGLVVLAPVLAGTALAIRVSLGSPVLFRQTRPGLRGVPFRLAKFRTMLDARDAQGELLSDRARLTPLGRFLRHASLDELPQLWNVLRGDMSLVGPRPLLMEYLDRYTPFQARRHEVRPGITGWAQINGRNALSWDEKFALDVWYVDHWSPVLDVTILAKTALRVFQRSGISKDGYATTVEYMGPGVEARPR